MDSAETDASVLRMSTLRKAVSNGNTARYAQAALGVAAELDAKAVRDADSGIIRVIKSAISEAQSSAALPAGV
jgi:hypothetical protein